MKCFIEEVLELYLLLFGRFRILGDYCVVM